MILEANVTSYSTELLMLSYCIPERYFHDEYLTLFKGLVLCYEFYLGLGKELVIICEMPM